MPNVTDIFDWVKGRVMYMTGRGLLNMVLLGAALTIPNISLSVFFVVAAVATGVLQGALIWRDQYRHEGRLVQDYRDEIAAKLGKDPTQVGRSDLHEIAHGDRHTGLPPNPFFKQALDQNGRRSLVRMVTTAASLFATVGAFFMLPAEVLSYVVESFQGLYTGAGLAPSNLTVFSAMVASGTGMGIINSVLDRTAFAALDIDHDTANKCVRDIRRKVRKNKIVKEIDTFGVFVAIDPILHSTIEESFGKEYAKLTEVEQQHAMERYGSYYPIKEITRDLNTKQIEADELAFLSVGQHSGVPKKQPQVLGKEKGDLEELGEAIEETIEESLAEDPDKQASHHPANDNAHKGSFVEKYAQQPRAAQGLSHAQRIRMEEALRDLQKNQPTK
ncbi:MAG: hypothetical protein MRY32_06090 [Rickettsiales bacterium]|nr:hypothetical protein [Rickettsiales bacterium]